MCKCRPKCDQNYHSVLISFSYLVDIFTTVTQSLWFAIALQVRVSTAVWTRNTYPIPIQLYYKL